jgi:hypothetical protein
LLLKASAVYEESGSRPCGVSDTMQKCGGYKNDEDRERKETRGMGEGEERQGRPKTNTAKVEMIDLL